MGATGTPDEDVARLLSVLRAASLRAQAQLGTATSTTTVDQHPESSRSETSDELDASERSTVVQAAVCSKPTPDGLTKAHNANVIWGARCGESARRVLLGETRSSGHAYSVRGARESAALRQAPHGLPSSRLVSTIPLDVWMRREMRSVRFCRYADDGVIHCQSAVSYTHLTL